MRISAIWKRQVDAIGRLSSLLFCVVLLGGAAGGTSVEAMGATAQSLNPSTAGAGESKTANSSSGLVTVLGAIRQVVSDHLVGTPAGIHILIDGPLGSFDASLGSYLPNEIRQALSNGASVQATGVVGSANGKDYLFVRQLTVAGHQVTIRNSNGFLVHPSSPPGSGPNQRHSEGNGGVQ
jgi:hypothetical protein